MCIKSIYLTNVDLITTSAEQVGLWLSLDEDTDLWRIENCFLFFLFFSYIEIDARAHHLACVEIYSHPWVSPADRERETAGWMEREGDNVEERMY
eukprot:gene7070-5008_t